MDELSESVDVALPPEGSWHRLPLRSDPARLLQILEATSDLVAITDEWGALEYLNPAGRDTLGLTEDEPVQSFTAADIHTPDEYARIMRTAEPVAVSNGLWSGESRLLRRDGVELPVSMVLVAHRTDSQTISHYSAIARDISEQKRTESQLRTGEQRLIAAMEAGNLGTWEWDIATNEVQWSDQCHRIMGFLPSDFVPRGYEKVIHIDDLIDLRHIVDCARITNDPIEKKIRIIQPGGEMRWCTLRGRFVLENGIPTKLVGVLMDITDSRRISDDLQRSERAFRTIVEQSPDIIWRVDSGLRLLYVSPQHLPGLGLDEEMLIGKSLLEIDPHPSNREMWKSALKTVFSGQGPVEVEHPFNSNGIEHWFLTQIASELEENGRISTAIAISRNITQRRKDEQDIRDSAAFQAQVLESLNEGVLVLDRSLVCRMWNSEMVRLSGLPAEVAIGMHVTELYPGIEELPIWLPLNRALTGEDVVIDDIEVPSKRVPGKVTWLSIHWSPWRNAGGEIEGVLVRLQDISERKQLASKLMQAQKMESIGRVASGIAHDFNNLLTAIIGFTESAEAQIGQGHPAQAHLQQVLSTAERASSLTHGLLAFGKRQVARPVPVRINDHIRVLEPVLRKLSGQAINLVFNYCPESPVISIDPSQLEQVVVNLIVNAREALPDAGTVTVITTLDPKYQKGAAQLIVIDNGVGMDEQTLEHIFEPFFSTKGSGTGLGLATCYGIVQKAGGHISVSSELGLGSTFTVSFPLCSAGSMAEAAAPGTDPTNPAQSILLVEDEPSVRALTARGLSDAGYRVISVESRMAALDVISLESPFSMLITDLVLPDGTGVEVASAFHQFHPASPVIFMSGHADIPEEQNEAVVTGHFLPKPFSTRALVGRVKELLV